MVAGGTVIGIITDRFAYVTMPAKPTRIELLPLGPRGQQVIAATVRQTGNGGSRNLLMLWTVWSGQLQPLESMRSAGARRQHALVHVWRHEGQARDHAAACGRLHEGHV